MKKKLISMSLILSLVVGMAGILPAGQVRAAAEKICIVLDPGHGGTDPGTTRGTATENELAFKVAKYAKAVLEQDDRFEVYLTREENMNPGLMDRAKFARDKQADVMVSLHFNSLTDTSVAQSVKGSEIWQSAIPAYQITGLPEKILESIHSETGLSVDRGVKIRKSGDNTYWNTAKNWDTDENTGVLADYYGLIKGSAKWGVPAMIVEHAFFTNDEDFAYLTSEDEAGVKALGEADAKALIAYYTGHDHIYGETETEYPVSCISEGRKAKHCKVCGRKKDVSAIASAPNTNGHFVTSYKVTKAATTTAEGVEQGICRYCGKTVTRTISKKKLTTSTKPATKKTSTVKKVSVSKAVITSAKKKKKTVTVTVKKIKNAAGYQVKAGSNRKITKQKKTVAGKKNKVTIKKWKKKTCYVKARAYKLNAKGKRVYGEWSKVKKVK